jgi:hypothetical protein
MLVPDFPDCIQYMVISPHMRARNNTIKTCSSCRMMLHEEDLEYLGANEQSLNAWRTEKGKSFYDAPLEDYLKERRADLEAQRYDM